jgi:hypothetical protein
MWGRLSVASEKVAFVNSQKANDVQKSYFKNSPRMMTQKIYTYLYGVGMMRNNFIYDVTDEVMSKLVENGIPQYFLRYIRETILQRLPSDVKEPRKFSLDDLQFGFFIHLSCLGISIFVFALEMFIRPLAFCWSLPNQLFL